MPEASGDPAEEAADAAMAAACLPLLLRGSGGGGGRWAFQALGLACTGRSWEESLTELQATFHKPLDAFQQLPSDIEMLSTGGHCVVSL
mmetsp:Transcript_113955/g.285077  ORF Transcript_113955/g.285077 Transcript_113955/m.285077 type:complete len:89 (+) Transcript_113955:696-962(+)